MVILKILLICCQLDSLFLQPLEKFKDGEGICPVVRDVLENVLQGFTFHGSLIQVDLDLGSDLLIDPSCEVRFHEINV